MHPSSLQNMLAVRSNYLFNLKENLTILDVGGRGLDNDRSYKIVFEDLRPNYLVADIVDGLGVTHVMPGPYSIPLPDSSVDLVVSGQMLEHCSNPFKSVKEMKRVLKTGSFMVLIAPSSGPKHDDQDCWRFMDDAFKAIAEDIGGITIIADWITKDATDDRSRKWQDHVFVGRKK